MQADLVSSESDSETVSGKAFFYGTLMHPEILRGVIRHRGMKLKICPALLLDYTRHRVKSADYPGILPYSTSQQMFIRNLNMEEKSVRGTLITGLTRKDIRLLDVFEGDEYTREVVNVHLLGPLTSLAESSVSQLLPSKLSPVPAISELPPPIQVETYVYSAPLSDLRAELWDFDQFMDHDAWKWF